MIGWKASFTALCLAFVGLCAAAGAASAQQAEPVRIRFARNTHSATVKGILRDRQQREYVVGAAAGQKIECRLHAIPAGSVAPKLIGPKNQEIALAPVERDIWAATLADTGDMVIAISRVDAERGHATFSLTVEIR